jgi:hypothetical protein
VGAAVAHAESNRIEVRAHVNRMDANMPRAALARNACQPPLRALKRLNLKDYS